VYHEVTSLSCTLGCSPSKSWNATGNTILHKLNADIVLSPVILQATQLAGRDLLISTFVTKMLQWEAALSCRNHANSRVSCRISSGSCERVLWCSHDGLPLLSRAGRYENLPVSILSRPETCFMKVFSSRWNRCICPQILIVENYDAMCINPVFSVNC
jgi:hypothetical protein